MIALAQMLRGSYDVDLVSLFPLDAEKMQERQGIDLDGLRVRALHRSPGPLYRWLDRHPRWHLYRDLSITNDAIKASRGYDLFVAQYFMTLAPARGRVNILHTQFPHPRRSWKFFLRRPQYWPYAALRFSLFRGELASYRAVVTQSEFVRHWTRRLWQIEPEVVFPPCQLAPNAIESPRQQIILAVARFFGSGYNKSHAALIEGFRALCNQGVTGWELHLVGSRHYEKPEDILYYDNLVRQAEGLAVVFHPDLPHSDLESLHRRASIFWHAAGYGADLDGSPQNAEHFGMSTVEAMSWGVVPVVIGIGGQAEIVRDGVDGRTWTEVDQLAAITRDLIVSPAELARLSRAARDRSALFGPDQFRAGFSRLLQKLGLPVP
jgi:glycosyltransferase involved in cell wall biosynthesis